MDNLLQAKGDINLGSDPEREVLVDPASESESDAEGGGGEEGGRARVTPRIKKRGTRVFRIAIKNKQLNKTQRILQCGPS